MMKYTTGIGLVVFGVGLVSGMLVQRALTPAPVSALVEEARLDSDPVPPRDDPPIELRRERRAPHDESSDWFAFAPVPPAETPQTPRAATPAAGPDASVPEYDNRENPWVRGPWTNRGEWIERIMAERESRIERMRSNLYEKANLNEQQAVRFEVLMAAMNLRLKEQAALWRAAIDTGAMSRPEARARAMKEIGAAVALTYDELDRNMPPGWRTATTNEMLNLWTFIDPEVWRDLRPLMGRGRPPMPSGDATSAGGR